MNFRRVWIFGVIFSLFFASIFLNFYRSGYSHAVPIDSVKCSEYGGVWDDINKRCTFFLDEEGSMDFSVQDTDELNNRSKVYTQVNKCPEGYKVDITTSSSGIGGRAIYRCVKDGSKEAIALNDSKSLIERLKTEPAYMYTDYEQAVHEVGPQVISDKEWEDIEKACGGDSKCIIEESKKLVDDRKGFNLKLNSNADVDPGENSCNVRWFGPIVCPGVSIFATATVWAYDFIRTNFLTIQSGRLFAYGGKTYEYWRNFRDIANIILAILVVFVVGSQITGYGISNYGIKKMLPKIIIFAILINISWFVVVAFVDLSNILGSSIYQFMNRSGWRVMESGENSIFLKLIKELLSGAMIAGGAAVATAVVATTAISSVFLGWLASAALAIMLMAVLLGARNAVVVVLVVVAPLAFVSSIIPQSKNFYKKWSKLLKACLIIYPLCSVMVGGMIVASNALVSSTSNGFMRLLFSTMPLMGIFSLTSITKRLWSVLDEVTGSNISAKIKGGFDKLNKSKNEFVKSHSDIHKPDWQRDLENVGRLHQLKMGRIARGNDAEFNQKYYGKKITKFQKAGDKFGEVVARGELRRANSELRKQEVELEKMEKENIEWAAQGILSSKPKGIDTGVYLEDRATAMLNSGKPNEVKVLHQAIMNGNMSGAQRIQTIKNIVENPKNNEDGARQLAKLTVDKSGKSIASNNAPLARYLQEVARGGNRGSFGQIANDASTYTSLTSSELSSQNEDVLKHIQAVSGNFSQSDRDAIKMLAESALENPDISSKLKPQILEALESIANM